MLKQYKTTVQHYNPTTLKPSNILTLQLSNLTTSKPSNIRTNIKQFCLCLVAEQGSMPANKNEKTLGLFKN